MKVHPISPSVFTRASAPSAQGPCKPKWQQNVPWTELGCQNPAAKLAVVEGSCCASCEALSKRRRIESGKSSKLLTTFGHDAGVSLEDLLESLEGSDSGSPVRGRTALGDGPAAKDAGLRRAVQISGFAGVTSIIFSFRNFAKRSEGQDARCLLHPPEQAKVVAVNMMVLLQQAEVALVQPLLSLSCVHLGMC